MSRIGKKPLTIPSGVNVELGEGVALVKGNKGEIKLHIPANVKVDIKDAVLGVSSVFPNLVGLTRTLIANAVIGVTDGFSKSIELTGTGYRANVSGANLQLSLGFSHPVSVVPPVGISFDAKDGVITVRGIDKVMVGEIAAKIRALKPADPYKAKGFKYVGEVIIKKAGKAAKAGGGK